MGEEDESVFFESVVGGALMNEKRRGHVVCPNCGKESYVIVRRGEAEVWCRRCRKYFRIVIESKATSGSEK